MFNTPLCNYRPKQAAIIAEYIQGEFSMFNHSPIQLMTQEECAEAGVQGWWSEYAKPDDVAFVTKRDLRQYSNDWNKVMSAIGDFKNGYNYIADVPFHKLDDEVQS